MRSMFTATSFVARVIVSVAFAGMAKSIIALRNEFVSAPEECTLTLRAGWSFTATWIVPLVTDA
jgi:hypothetical protein